MNKPLKAIVISGRYKGETVRITNISQDELGRKSAACFLSNGNRANIRLEELSLLEERPEPEIHRPRTSMPFVGGSTGSRSMNQTKSLVRARPENKTYTPAKKQILSFCEVCGVEYNQEERKGRPGKITVCENCAEETETKMEGTMIFSHKTGSTIEIKKDGELKHEAPIFDPKNKT